MRSLTDGRIHLGCLRGSGILAGVAVLIGLAFPGAASLTASAASADGHPGKDGHPSLGTTNLNPERFGRTVTLSGKVWLAENHIPEEGHPQLRILVTNDEKRYGLYGEKAERLKVGEGVSLTGRIASPPRHFRVALHGDLLVAGAKVASRKVDRGRFSPRVDQTGRQGFIIAFLSWPGSGPSSFSEHSQAVAGLTPWSRSASDGRFAWDPADAVDLRLESPLPGCSAPDSAPLDTWVTRVREALAREGYDLSSRYQALGLALPEGASICRSAAAFAFYSERCKWLETITCGLSIYGPGMTTGDILIHELGHNLGLPHANTARCTSNGVQMTFGYENMNCQLYEYADVFDPMGMGFLRSTANGFNPAYIDELGWLEERDVFRIPIWGDIEQTVRLKPFGETAGPRVVQAFLPQAQTPSGQAFPGKLYLEYRANAGLDELLLSEGSVGRWPCQDGGRNDVYLRVVPTRAGFDALGLAQPSANVAIGSYSILLDSDLSTPIGEGPEWLCDAGLSPGESWTDPTGNLNIEFLDRAPNLSSANVRITSRGLEGPGSSLQVTKLGDGRGRVVSDPAGVDCSDRCTNALGTSSKIRLRSIPARGSKFSGWGPGACSTSFIKKTCVLDFDTATKTVEANFELDPMQTRPDVELGSLALAPRSVSVKSGRAMRLKVSIINKGLDPQRLAVKLGMKRRILKGPKTVVLNAAGRKTTTKAFRVRAVKRKKGKVVVSASVGGETVRASVRITR